MSTKKAKASGDKSAQKKSTKRAKDQTSDLRIMQSGDIGAIRESLNQKFKATISTEVKDKPVIILPTGILSMDLAVANGGLLGGRIMDIYGWEGTGKTLMCMTIGGYIQRCTKLDASNNVVPKLVAFLDAEGTFSASFARSAGMDTDNLILVQSTPDKILSGEEYFDIIVMLLYQGVDYIIVDSTPALVPSQVLAKETGQGQKATNASLMSTGLQKINPLVNSTGQSVVHFINQKRSRPMAMSWQKDEIETGGNALKFYSSYRFEVTKSEDIIKKVLGADGSYRDKKVGINSKICITKNKTSPIPPSMPDGRHHFDFDVYTEDFIDEAGREYHRGVDVVKDYVETAWRCGVVKQKSSWYSFGKFNENGKDALIMKIRENPEVMNDIRAEVFDVMKVSLTQTGMASANGAA